MTGEYRNINVDWISIDAYHGKLLSASQVFEKVHISFDRSNATVFEKVKNALLSAVLSDEYKKLPVEERIQVLASVVTILERLGVPINATLAYLQGLAT